MFTRIRHSKKYLFIILAVFVSAILPGSVRTFIRKFEHADMDHLRCAIAIKAHDDTTTTALLTGYSYDLLQRFAKAEDITLNIVLQQKGENYLDSVLLGTADVVVLPYVDTATYGGIDLSRPIDSLIVVGFAHHTFEIARKTFDKWYSDFSQTEEGRQVRARFFTTAAPSKRKTGGYAGPYDDLIKKYADQIGWDWRMLAALVYQESHFKIEATSYRGARGLMQMMPSTASGLGTSDIINPEESIKAGARYLDKLQKMFRKVAASKIEREKMTLAAYNAGEGRILDCINFARLKGVDPSTWDAIVSVIPEMREETILDVDTVKLGVFKGYETIAYVNKVTQVYSQFCRLCPEN